MGSAERALQRCQPAAQPFPALGATLRVRRRCDDNSFSTILFAFEQGNLITAPSHSHKIPAN
jgi:hypothetical protein